MGSATAQKQLRSHSEPPQLSPTKLSQISWSAQTRLLIFSPAAFLIWAAVERPWAFGCSMENTLSFALISAGAGLKSEKNKWTFAFLLSFVLSVVRHSTNTSG